MANINQVKLPDNSIYNFEDDTQSRSDHRHYETDRVPLVHKVYESTSYYASANDYANASWYFMSIKPDEWGKPWRIKFKVHSYCPNYTSTYQSYTWSTVCGRADGFIYANWNERNSSAHSYILLYPLKSAGFTAGYGHALAISIYNADNRTSSAYYRTFEVDLYDTENCTVEFLDTPVKWASWTGGTSTNYGSLASYNAIDRGLQETGDTNDIDNRILYFAGKTGAKGVWATSLFMEDAYGTYQNICTASDGTVTSSNRTTGTKYANTNGFKVGSPIWYTNTGYNANTNISGYGNVYKTFQLFDTRYSFNTTLTAGSLTAYKPLYLVGTIHSDGLYYLDTTWWTQTPTDQSKIYVLVGGVYDSTTSNCRATLYEQNKWFRYDGTQLVEIANDALTVSGHTVATDVPSGAVFTDQKVTQTETSGNNTYEVLFSGTADNVTRTEGTNKSNKLRFNPSTGQLMANILTADSVDADWIQSLKLVNNTYISKVEITYSGVVIRDDNNTDVITLDDSGDITAITLNGSTIGSSPVFTDTWKANSVSSEGYVASGSGQVNKVWKTTGAGVPGWTDDSSLAYSTGSSDTAGRWTVTIPGITQLYDGLTIRIYLTKSYNSTFNTLNVNNLGEVLVKYRAGNQLTSHVPQYACIVLTYKTGLTAYAVSNAYCDPVNNANYRGNWAANTTYAVGDSVQYSSKYYICKTAHTSGASWATTNWNTSTTPYSTLAVSTNATTNITDGWLLQTTYTSGTDTYTIRPYYSRVTTGGNGVKQYSLFARLPNSKYSSFTTNSGTGTKTFDTTNYFDPRKIFYYNGSSNIAVNTLLSNNTVGMAVCRVDMRYSFSGVTTSASTSSLTATTPIYVVFDKSAKSDGCYKLKSPYITQTPNDTSAIYTLIGYMEDSYRGDLWVDNPVFEYNGTNLVPYVSASYADSAGKLSNTTKIGDTNQPVYFTASGVPTAISYTIAANVPSGAVFTDYNVNQADGADANAHYKLLFEDTASSSTIIGGTRKTSHLTYNPSTSYLTIEDTTPGGGTLSVHNVSATSVASTNFTGSTLNGQTIPASPVFTDQAVQQLEGGNDIAYEVLYEDTASSGNTTSGTRKSSNLTYNPVTNTLSLAGKMDCTSMAVSTPTYSMSKTSGTWNVGSVSAKRTGNIVQMTIIVKGTGTGVNCGTDGFVGQLSGTGPAPAQDMTLVSYTGNTTIMGYIDTSRKIWIRPIGSGTYTAGSGSNIQVDGCFICE